MPTTIDGWTCSKCRALAKEVDKLKAELARTRLDAVVYTVREAAPIIGCSTGWVSATNRAIGNPRLSFHALVALIEAWDGNKERFDLEPPRIYPLGRNAKITATPGVCGTDICVEGTRIGTWVIAQAREAGDTVAAIAANYQLPIETVAAVLDGHKVLRRRGWQR